MSRRAVCYLIKVWQTFGELGIPRERLVEIGWTKAAIVLENSGPEDVEEALALAETCTAKDLPALLKGTPQKAKARTVLLRLTPRQYAQFEAVMLANALDARKKGGACPARKRALMKALGKSGPE